MTEINEALNGAPETINTDANETWLYKFELADGGELTSLDTLMDAAAYEDVCQRRDGTLTMRYLPKSPVDR